MIELNVAKADSGAKGGGYWEWDSSDRRPLFFCVYIYIHVCVSLSVWHCFSHGREQLTLKEG